MTNIPAGAFPLLAPDGSAAAPSYSFSNDPDCGMYRVGTNAIGFSTGGAVALTLDSSQNVSFANIISGPAGSTSNPTYTFTADPNTGFYNNGSDSLALVTGGVAGILIDPAQRIGLSAGINTSSLVNSGDVNALSSTTQINLRLGGFVANSSATVAAHGISNSVGTANSSFTVPVLAHFRSVGVAKGAASTVTRAIGYYANTAMTTVGATSSAEIADNVSFTSDWFLNSTSIKPSLFSGTLTAPNFISGSANPASAGVIRLAYLDTFKFRNSNNNGDLSLVQSSTDGVLTYNGDDIVLRTLAQTLTTKTLTTPIISGVSDGSSASAGNVGEYILATLARASASSLTASTPLTIITQSLTAGDWDVSGVCSFLPGAATTYTDILWGISKTLDTLNGPTGGIDSTGICTFRQGYPSGTLNGGIDLSYSIPQVRVSLSSTTNIYLVAQSNFGASTMKAYGNLTFRRVR